MDRMITLAFFFMLVAALSEGMGGMQKSPPSGVSPFLTERIRELIRRQSSESFKVRDQAAKELKSLGEVAIPQLQAALKAPPNLETARRLQQIIENIAPVYSLNQIAERLGNAIAKHSHIGKMNNDVNAIFEALGKGGRKTLQRAATEMEGNEFRLLRLLEEIVNERDEEKQKSLEPALRRLCTAQVELVDEVSKAFEHAIGKAGYKVIFSVPGSRQLIGGISFARGRVWDLTKDGESFVFEFDGSVFSIRSPREAIQVAPHQVLPANGRYPDGRRTSTVMPNFSAQLTLSGSLSSGRIAESRWGLAQSSTEAAFEYLERTFDQTPERR